jgi:hypothetical protein
MKTRIIKLLAVFLAIIAFGVVSLIILSKNNQFKGQTITQPASLSAPAPAKITAEIVKESGSGEDEITEEYHLYAQITFLNNKNEKMPLPYGKLDIKLFAPITGTNAGPNSLFMKPFLTKKIDLGKVEEIHGEFRVHLLSGIKLTSDKKDISVSAEYTDSEANPEKPIRLRYDITLFQY